ncbi:MAG TPA: LysM peptidoglycan-binding domain-containing protein [Acidimicrobiales bacterium]
MVAIHIPSETSEQWGFDPAGTAPGPGSVRRGGPTAAPPRRRTLPDRPTRVRRRRLAALVLAVALGGAVAVGVQTVSGLSRVDATSGPRPVDVRSVPVAGQSYVVQPGDTLWSIAAEIAPDSDPRPVVDALREANGGPVLEVGTRLTLDVG